MQFAVAFAIHYGGMCAAKVSAICPNPSLVFIIIMFCFEVTHLDSPCTVHILANLLNLVKLNRTSINAQVYAWHVPMHYLRLLRCLFSMCQLAVAWVWRRIYEGSERRDQPWECFRLPRDARIAPLSMSLLSPWAWSHSRRYITHGNSPGIPYAISWQTPSNFFLLTTRTGLPLAFALVVPSWYT